MFKPSDPVRRVIRIAGLILGVGLLAGAVLMGFQVDLPSLAHGRLVFHADLSKLAYAHPWQWGVLAVAVVGNLALVAALFWVVTLSFDATPAVSYGRMFLLIGASSLLNYLPLRPGLVGRAAWLKLRHGLPIRQSILGLAIMLAVGITVTVGIWATMLLPPPGVVRAVVMLLALGVCSVVAGPLTKLFIRRRLVAPMSWIVIKVADAMVAGVRIYIAFGVIGQPVTYGQALLIGVSGQLVSMAGITPNGMGVKEWVQAMTASAILEPSIWDYALKASLVDRAMEAVVTTVAGLIGLGMIKRIKASPLCQASRPQV